MGPKKGSVSTRARHPEVKVGERKDRPSAAAVGGLVMTPVAVQSVAPAKGMKAGVADNVSAGGVAATDCVGATPIAAVALTVLCAVVICSSS